MNKSRSLYHRVVFTVTVMCTVAVVLILYIFLSMLDDSTRTGSIDMRAHNIFLGTAIGFLVILYIFVYFYIRRLFKPMAGLKKGVESVAKGDFDVQIPIKTNDEFGELSQSFNKMAGEIQAMVKYKDQLLSDVSHELRTPITRLRLAAEMMEDGKQKESMISDLREMSYLVENLLESNRLNYGVGSLNKQPFNLTDLLETLAHEQAGKSPGISFSPQDEHLIEGDESLVKILFRNLLNNAHKYSAEQNKAVELHIEDLGRLIQVRIKDYGIGIPQELLNLVFEPFYRVEQSRSKNTGGYGLGLNISKKVVEAHGGSIKIQNNAGNGLLVTVELPKS